MITAQKSKSKVLMASKAHTSSETTTASLDTLGCDYVEIEVNLGIEKNTNAIGPTIILSEGDTTSSYATWSSSCTITGADGDLAAAKEIRWLIPTSLRKRYLKLSIATGTATNDDVTFGSIARLTRQESAPGSTSDMVSTTNDIVTIF